MKTMQFSLRYLILAITAIAVCIALAGRMTMSGVVIVSQQNIWYVEAVLGSHGAQSWNSHSSLGGTLISFPDPFSITFVDDAIAQDAEERGYCVEIQYNALFPQFSSSRIVNPDPEQGEPLKRIK